MNELFKKDITIKIVSVLVAVILWLYVYNTADNPMRPEVFENIPVRVENESSLADKGLKINNKYRTTVDITVEGRKDVLAKVRDTDFEVVLDLSKVNSVEDKRIRLNDPKCSQSGVTIKTIYPMLIDLELIKMKGDFFPVEIEGELTAKTGFKVYRITSNPENLFLEGEEGLINRVGSIKAVWNQKNLDRDITKRINCKVFDRDGKEISELSKNNLSCEVKVEVAKEVPITLTTKGKLAQDFVETLRVLNPEKALITGPPELLEKITELKTKPVDIENINQDMNVTGLIELPEGVKLVDITTREVAVNITVEHLEVKDYSISTDLIVLTNMDALLKYIVKPGNLSFQLKGKMNDLNGIAIDHLRPSVDVAGLSEGVHNVPLHINLPASVKLLQDVFVEVKVEKAPEIVN